MALKPKNPFEANRGVENRYAIQLRQLANKIGQIITGFSDPLNDADQRRAIDQTMARYADTITPWAQDVASRVIAQVDLKNRAAYAQHSADMSRYLQRELQNAPTGKIMGLLRAEQVELIRSLPTEAAERVHRLAQQNLVTGARASELERMLMRSGDVTKSRATLIARTETSRVSSNLTQARAMYVGSVAYLWRTARDKDVRPSHRAMEGQPVNWDNPPTLDNLRGHAGCLPNCRCHPEPIIPLT